MIPIYPEADDSPVQPRQLVQFVFCMRALICEAFCVASFPVKANSQVTLMIPVSRRAERKPIFAPRTLPTLCLKKPASAPSRVELAIVSLNSCDQFPQLVPPLTVKRSHLAGSHQTPLGMMAGLLALWFAAPHCCVSGSLARDELQASSTRHASRSSQLDDSKV